MAIIKKAFKIPSIIESLKRDIASGEMSIIQATEELYKAGWLTYLNIDKAKQLLEIKY